MFGINYSGLKKRNTYAEIASAIETDKTKIKYPNRKATRYLNDPHVLAITSASDLENEWAARKYDEERDYRECD